MASSAPAMSAQPIVGASSGRISSGRVRGIIRLTLNSPTTSRPMKMIGSQSWTHENTSG